MTTSCCSILESSAPIWILLSVNLKSLTCKLGIDCGSNLSVDCLRSPNDCFNSSLIYGLCSPTRNSSNLLMISLLLSESFYNDILALSLDYDPSSFACISKHFFVKFSSAIWSFSITCIPFISFSVAEPKYYFMYFFWCPYYILMHIQMKQTDKSTTSRIINQVLSPIA